MSTPAPSRRPKQYLLFPQCGQHMSADVAANARQLRSLPAAVGLNGTADGALRVGCETILSLLNAPLPELVAVLNAPQWWLFALLGVLGAGLSFAFYVVGLKRTAPTLAAIVAMVEPVTASLFGVLVLGETLAPLQILGLVLILVTVTGLSLYSNRRR